MRKEFMLTVVLSAFALGCTIEMRRPRSAYPPPPPRPAPQSTIQPEPTTPAPTTPTTRIGRTHRYGSTSTSPVTLPTMTGTNVFGSSYDDPNGYAGTLYAIPEGTTKLPDLNALTPIGRLYASTLNVRPRPMSGGFPGIAPYRNEYFAIRWEAPLVVNNEGDYTFRVASEKGSVVRIDDMVIVDNDGNHPYAERSGPVHLIKTTHVITIDYFQTTGNVALQLFCKRHGEAEMICPTRL